MSTKMDKPKITDYVEMPISTTTGTNYNYQRYSIALEAYIKHLESKVKNLTIQRVSNSYIELTREDLQKDKSNKPIDKITLYDFKGSVMTREQMCKAEIITFVDGDDHIDLKHKYKVW